MVGSTSAEDVGRYVGFSPNDYLRAIALAFRKMHEADTSLKILFAPS